MTTLENWFNVGILSNDNESFKIREACSLSVHPGFVSLSYIDENGEFQVDNIKTDKFYVTVLGKH